MVDDAGEKFGVGAPNGGSIGVLPQNFQRATGITVKVNTIVNGVPKKITHHIGFQSALPESTIGNTPIVAAAEVRKIGRIRRFADSRLAFRLSKPSCPCNCSA